MLKLAESAPIDNKKIQVACVSDEHVKPNSTCWTAGWGEQLSDRIELHTIRLNGKLFCRCKQFQAEASFT